MNSELGTCEACDKKEVLNDGLCEQCVDDSKK